jgi:hypothetical protein
VHGVAPGIFHLDALAYLEQLGSQGARIEAHGRTHGVEVLIVIELKSLRFPARAKVAAAPILHRRDYHCRPKSAFPNQLFGDSFLQTALSAC